MKAFFQKNHRIGTKCKELQITVLLIGTIRCCGHIPRHEIPLDFPLQINHELKSRAYRKNGCNGCVLSVR